MSTATTSTTTSTGATVVRAYNDTHNDLVAAQDTLRRWTLVRDVLFLIVGLGVFYALFATSVNLAAGAVAVLAGVAAVAAVSPKIGECRDTVQAYQNKLTELGKLPANTHI